MFMGVPGLGALGGLASKAAGLGQLSNLSSTLNGAVGELAQNLMPPALQNVSEIFAHTQAQQLRFR
jgi:hypothetical protein